MTLQAQIMELLAELGKKEKMAVLLITHNMGLVSQYCERVVVMYAGHIAEVGDTRSVLKSPSHPYTQALFSAVPDIDPDIKRERIMLPGEISSAVGTLPACRFFNRCRLAREGLCDVVEPELRNIEGHHFVACHMVK